MEPLVSLCMMVKNEALCLEKCLESIIPIADEIIIVDTGSTDGTQDIISRYTDKVYTWDWNNDFAAARNYVASLATGKYVCRWDADWVLRQGDMEKIMQAKNTGFKNAEEVHFNWINEFNDNTRDPISMVTHMFLYKRELFEWYCAVPAHDMTRPLDTNLTVNQLILSDIWVYHEKDPQVKQFRYDQTHQLIADNLQKMPANHPDRMTNLQFYLSSCLFREEFAEALKTIEEMLLSISPKNDLFYWLLEQHITCLINLSELEQAYTIALGYYQKYHEYHTILALADIVLLLDSPSAKELYQEYLDYPFDSENLDINYERYRVHPVAMLGILNKDKDLLYKAVSMTRRPTTKSKLAKYLT